MNLQASETSQETSDLREKRWSEREKMRMEEQNKLGGGREGGGAAQNTSGAMTKKKIKSLGIRVQKSAYFIIQVCREEQTPKTRGLTGFLTRTRSLLCCTSSYN